MDYGAFAVAYFGTGAAPPSFGFKYIGFFNRKEIISTCSLPN